MATLKYDLIYINEFETPRELRRAITAISMSTIHTGHIPQLETCAQTMFTMANFLKLPDNIKTRKEINLEIH